VRLYTSLYPAEVKGLVIVDGTHEQQVQRRGKLDSAYPGAFRAFFEDRLKTLKPGAEAADWSLSWIAGKRWTVAPRRSPTCSGDAIAPRPSSPKIFRSRIKGTD